MIAKHQNSFTVNSSSLPAEKLQPSQAIPSIYPAILADPTVPQVEKDPRRLEDDALFVMMAGTDAPAQVLAITLFHILNNPEVHHKLQAELLSGIPDPSTIPSLKELEKISYLVVNPTYQSIHYMTDNVVERSHP